MNFWTLPIDETGVLKFPPELLDQVGWKEGDNLLWIDNKDGSWSLIKEPLTSMIIDYTISKQENNL